MQQVHPGYKKKSKHITKGGRVVGPGTGTSDDVRAVVADGSYIMPADSTARIGEKNLAGLGRGVAVNLSNGEYQLSPQQVHAIGVQVLEQLKNATHTSVMRQARGFKPQNFFADGGEVEDPVRKLISQSSFADTVPRAPLPVDTSTSSGGQVSAIDGGSGSRYQRDLDVRNAQVSASSIVGSDQDRALAQTNLKNAVDRQTAGEKAEQEQRQSRAEMQMRGQELASRGPSASSQSPVRSLSAVNDATTTPFGGQVSSIDGGSGSRYQRDLDVRNARVSASSITGSDQDRALAQTNLQNAFDRQLAGEKSEQEQRQSRTEMYMRGQELASQGQPASSQNPVRSLSAINDPTPSSGQVSSIDGGLGSRYQRDLDVRNAQVSASSVTGSKDDRALAQTNLQHAVDRQRAGEQLEQEQLRLRAEMQLRQQELASRAQPAPSQSPVRPQSGMSSAPRSIVAAEQSNTRTQATTQAATQANTRPTAPTQASSARPPAAPRADRVDPPSQPAQPATMPQQPAAMAELAPASPVAAREPQPLSVPEEAQKPEEKKKAAPKGLKGHIGDTLISLVKGAVAVPEAVVGLIDIPARGTFGKFLENKDGIIGYRPKETHDILDSWYSDEYKEQKDQLKAADGIVAKAKVALSNPSLITNTAAEFLPSMPAGRVAGSVLLRGARGLGMGASATGKRVAIANATGEGAMAAGKKASELRNENSDGLLTREQQREAVLDGVLEAVIPPGFDKIKRSLGFGDVAGNLATASSKSTLRKVVEGALPTNVLEDAAQAVTTTAIGNYVMDRDLSEGMDKAVAKKMVEGVTSRGVRSIAGASKGFHPSPDTSKQTATTPARETTPAPAAPTTTSAPVATPVAASNATAHADGRHRQTGSDDNQAPSPANRMTPDDAQGRAPVPLAPPSQQTGMDPNAGTISGAAALGGDRGTSPQAPNAPARQSADQAAYRASNPTSGAEGPAAPAPTSVQEGIARIRESKAKSGAGQNTHAETAQVIPEGGAAATTSGRKDASPVPATQMQTQAQTEIVSAPDITPARPFPALPAPAVTADQAANRAANLPRGLKTPAEPAPISFHEGIASASKRAKARSGADGTNASGVEGPLRTEITPVGSRGYSKAPVDDGRLSRRNRGAAPQPIGGTNASGAEGLLRTEITPMGSRGYSKAPVNDGRSSRRNRRTAPQSTQGKSHGAQTD